MRAQSTRKPVQARSKIIKARIMLAAHEVMRVQGIRALTTNAVANEAGVKVGSVYDYFPNKEAIIAELYEQRLAEVRSFLKAGSETIDPQRWQSDLAQLIRDTWAYQFSLGLDRTLVDAAYYYEKLFPIARAHAHLLAATYVSLLRRLGSPLPEEKLVDLGITLYTLVNATWSYWRLQDSLDPIAIDRQIRMTIMLIEEALDPAQPSLGNEPQID